MDVDIVQAGETVDLVPEKTNVLACVRGEPSKSGGLFGHEEVRSGDEFVCGVGLVGLEWVDC